MDSVTRAGKKSVSETIAEKAPIQQPVSPCRGGALLPDESTVTIDLLLG